MSLALYQWLQPFLAGAFGFAARLLPAGVLPKLRATWEIRYPRLSDGRRVPAYQQIDPTVFAGTRPVWIHAASGEFEYAKPVIRELAASGEKIFVTYFSPTYADNVRRFQGVTASCPLPFDDVNELSEMIARVKPKALLIARTDVWANTVACARESQVPTLLFSATFHSGSKRMGAHVRSLTAASLKLLSTVHCVSEDDRATLRTIGVEQVEVHGDSRYDQVLKRLQEPKPLPSHVHALLHPDVLVAGSVWREDVGALLPATQSKKTFVLVPHEIDESLMAMIEAEAKRLGRSHVRLSRASATSAAPTEIVIVDQVGILAELYTLGRIGFVGGSFRKSVHSVMEPLAAGLITFVGPHHTNNREALEFQTLPLRKTIADAPTLSMVVAANSGFELAQWLEDAWQLLRAEDAESIRDQIRGEVAKRGGATNAILTWLRSRSPQPS